METDWQIHRTKIRKRKELLISEIIKDCQFLVGRPSKQSLIPANRLLLAKVSPVFERMFYGSLPEKEDPIVIPEIQPNVFKAFLYYTYTNQISIASFDHACKLYYLAQKYMIPHVLEHCSKFLLADLSPKNACRVYEFGKFFEDPRLMERSMELIACQTAEIIADPSFMDIEVSTLLDILDQNRLSIDSELDLFNCLLKLANDRGLLNDGDKDNTGDTGSENENDVAVVEEIKLELDDSNSEEGTCGNVFNFADEVVEVDSDASASGKAVESTADVMNIMDGQRSNTKDEAMLLQAVKKIRFLAMTPQQFAEGPARSRLLNQNESLAILTKLVSPTINDCPMPKGFCQSSKRGSDHKKLKCYYFCKCCISEYYHERYLNYSLPFKVDRNIYLLGVQIKTGPEGIRTIRDCYVTIQSMALSQIASSYSTICHIRDSVLEFVFNKPVFLYRNQMYIVELTNRHERVVQMCAWDYQFICNGVMFTILPSFINNVCPIYGIVFANIHNNHD